MTHKSWTHPIRDGVVQALRGEGGIFTETSEAVSRAIRDACYEAAQAGASPAESIGTVVKSAVQGISESDNDAAVAIRGITVGVVQGTRASSAAATGLLSCTARLVIHETLRRGGDLAQAARGVIEGALHTAKELEMNPMATASIVAEAAGDAAAELSPTGAQKVRVAASQSIDRIGMNREPSDQRPIHP